MSKRSIGVFGGLLLFMLICAVISYNKYTHETYDSSSLILKGAIGKHHVIYNSSSVILDGAMGEHHEMYESSSVILAGAVGEYNGMYNSSSIGEVAVDYLTEREALRDGPITDLREAVSIENSSVQLLNRNSAFKTGEYIELAITLRNGYGEIRRKGGDKLEVRILSTALQAFAPGYVVDHRNGSYTAVVHALWPGISVISVKLAFGREVIRTIYAKMHKHEYIRTVAAGFESGSSKEDTICQPRREWLTQYKSVCNLTMDNGGMSWYCGKPKNTILLCEDWTYVTTTIEKKAKLMNDVEMKLLKGGWQQFPNVTVKVKGDMKPRDNLPLCSSIPKKDTWTLKKPTGFFYKNVWYLNHCKVPKEINYRQCLSNTRLMIFGDSTTRQWYFYMMENLGCAPLTEKWTHEKWHKRSACTIRKINCTIEWIPHAQPFNTGLGKVETNKYTTHSIAGFLNQLSYLPVSSKEKLIVVVHIFMHFSHFHHSIFRDRMRVVSKSVKYLLQRNRDVQILIKGPHTLLAEASLYRELYTQILKEEFLELYDQLVFMEQGDMTIAKENTEVHPANDILQAAIRQLFGYAC